MQPAAAEALQRAEGDQLGHVLGDAAQRRADEEDHDRRLQHDLAAVEVAELPVERPGDRRGEQVRGHDPREVLRARRGRRRSSAARSTTIVWSSDASRMTSISAPKIRRTRGAGCAAVLTRRSSETRHAADRLRLHTMSHDEDREDRRGVARRARPRAVPRAAAEGHRGAVHGRVRPRVRAGHVHLRRLRRRALRVGHEVRLGLRLACVLRARRPTTRSTRRPTSRTACCAPRCCARAAAATSGTCSPTAPRRPGSATASTRPR